MKPVVAAFDFDGTLSDGVSGLRFFRHLLGPWRYYAGFWPRHLPSLASYGLRWRHEASLVRINHAIFAGRPAAAVAEAGRLYARDILPRHLVPAAMDRLHWHREQGHRCLVVSRGYEVYLQPWAEPLGVSVTATRLAVDAHGRLTGAMPEPSCDGLEKPERLRRMIGDRSGVELHAYGDGPGDFALLAMADRAWLRGDGGFEPWRPEDRRA